MENLRQKSYLKEGTSRGGSALNNLDKIAPVLAKMGAMRTKGVKLVGEPRKAINKRSGQAMYQWEDGDHFIRVILAKILGENKVTLVVGKYDKKPSYNVIDQRSVTVASHKDVENIKYTSLKKDKYKTESMLRDRSYMEEGRALKIGYKNGNWVMTKFKPTSYSGHGEREDGVAKLLNQKTAEVVTVRNSTSTDSTKWKVSRNNRTIEDKNLARVISKLSKMKK